MKIYFFRKTIPIHSKYPRTKLHIGKTNPESLEEFHLSTKKRQQKVFFCLLLARNVSHVTRKFTPPTLILLLEHMADFGFEIIQLPFLFYLNKNISKTLNEVNICLKHFGKHCLKKKNKK